VLNTLFFGSKYLILSPFEILYFSAILALEDYCQWLTIEISYIEVGFKNTVTGRNQHMSDQLPSSYQIEIRRSGLLTYRLVTSQILPIGQEKAFSFFEDPGNLCDITPAWLDFCMLNKNTSAGVHGHAEFDYKIKFLGVKMHWRSRIIDYQPPERFTDIQLKGPYKSWIHLHVLEEVPEGTLMRDEITYKLYLPALVLHSFLIRKKLINIFNHRAVKIAEWAETMRFGGGPNFSGK
jgi:ligand-binding SRPBCC domain-containing protein